MNTNYMKVERLIFQILVLALLSIAPSFNAANAETDLADFPMAVNNQVKPNVLVIYDNSQSMDAYMEGMLVSGTDTQTRGNIGRQVMRDAITTYRDKFNWGLMTFELSGSLELDNTYVYYMGSDTGMTFTSDCTINDLHFGQTGVTSDGKPCVMNTQAGVTSDEQYLTYDKSSDDADILDVLYTTETLDQAWGTSTSVGTNYHLYKNRTVGASWGNFSDCVFPGTEQAECEAGFTATDAGFLTSNPPYTRQYYLPRGQGYYSLITGSGTLVEPVAADSTTHYDNLMADLGSETLDTSTSEIKNAALFTPLSGTLTAAKNYFTGVSSPISASCQKNFVMLVTDGLPTGNSSGGLYSAAERTNTHDDQGNWTWGTAAQDTFDAITALRSTVKGATTYDISTYIIALGDTVNNAGALAVMHQMASLGGTISEKLATNESSLISAINEVSLDILSRDGAAAAVTISNPNIVAGGINASYNSSYNSGNWTGDLKAFPVSASTGQIDTDSPLWATSAQAQLDTRTNGAYSTTARNIVTYSGSGGVQFQPSSSAASDAIVTKLTAGQEAAFNSTGMSDAAAVIQYLRGDRSGEGTTYRSRSHVLGDIVNAEAVLVQPPAYDYSDDCYSAAINGTCAQSFKSAQASRSNVIFQAANDGMVHAFLASSGAESWAYVPKLIWPHLVDRTKKSGFTHQYYVDATPVTGDVDFKNTDGGSNAYSNPSWHTLLVGGLGKGGRGYYALDVTTPTATSEADAASKVLWEFPNSSTSATDTNNMGYSYGRPIIVKTQAKGWVVLVASGYNNTDGDGHGRLYVLNPRNGAVIKTIDTGAGSAADPAGLARLSAYVDNDDLDDTVSYVYGGDLLGNVWRFDLTGNSVNQWTVKKLATLVDADNNVQSVTTEPELAEITIANSTYRFVYVGTGRYLGDSDVSTTGTQTMYGLIDDLSSSPEITPLRSNLQAQTMSVDPNNPERRTVTNHSVSYSGVDAKRGWYLDLISSGERIVTDPQIALGALAFTSNIPSSTQCEPGGSSWFYVIDVKTGGVLSDATDTSYSGEFLGDTLASRATLFKLSNGKVDGAIKLGDTTNVVKDLRIPVSSASGKRIAWKELITN